MILPHGWHTKQVNYTNALCQAEIKERIYIEPTNGFGGVDKIPTVLRLLESIYGLKQAPKTLFDKLKAGLLERNFVQSQIDTILFMKGNMICILYVDDKILCGLNLDEINQGIIGLGIKGEDHVHRFQLKDEGQVGDFLGIIIGKLGPGI